MKNLGTCGLIVRHSVTCVNSSLVSQVILARIEKTKKNKKQQLVIVEELLKLMEIISFLHNIIIHTKHKCKGCIKPRK